MAPSHYSITITQGDHQRLPSTDGTEWFVLTDPTTGEPLDLTDRTVEFGLQTRLRGGESLTLSQTPTIGDPTAGEAAMTLTATDTDVDIEDGQTPLWGEFRVMGGADDPTTPVLARDDSRLVRVTIVPSRV